MHKTVLTPLELCLTLSIIPFSTRGQQVIKRVLLFIRT